MIDTWLICHPGKPELPAQGVVLLRHLLPVNVRAPGQAVAGGAVLQLVWRCYCGVAASQAAHEGGTGTSPAPPGTGPWTALRSRSLLGSFWRCSTAPCPCPAGHCRSSPAPPGQLQWPDSCTMSCASSSASIGVLGSSTVLDPSWEVNEFWEELWRIQKTIL